MVDDDDVMLVVEAMVGGDVTFGDDDDEVGSDVGGNDEVIDVTFCGVLLSVSLSVVVSVIPDFTAPTAGSSVETFD